MLDYWVQVLTWESTDLRGGEDAPDKTVFLLSITASEQERQDDKMRAPQKWSQNIV